MKKWWFGEKKHIDSEKVALRAQAKQELRALMDCRDENGYVGYLKALNPDVSPEELIRLIELFRQQCEELPDV
jgi:hypothetical protein